MCIRDRLQGVLVLEAVHLRDAGVSLAAAAAQLESNRKTGRIFFTTNDLEYLKHGGRVGRAAAAAGSLLHVKPLIGYRDGGLISDGIAQGRKRSMQRVRELFCRYVEREGLDLSQYYVVTGCGLDEEEYRVFTDQLFEELEQGNINPASIISMFEEEEDQREAASLFHTKLERLESTAEQEKALHDIVCAVKRNSYERDSAQLGTDVAALNRVIAGKKQLEELAKTHISLE